MAKQRGIHQIKGKINNLCYYEQKYVRGGLIRRINEAMSERLKTDPVFANTRVANTIFGGCSQYARVIFDFFGNRNLYLFLPSRQARLTKLLLKNSLDYYDVELYPTIKLEYPNSSLFPYLIDNVVKNKLSIYFPSLRRFLEAVQIDSDVSLSFDAVELRNFCLSNNCESAQISISDPKYLQFSVYDEERRKYSIPCNNVGGRTTSRIYSINDNVSEVLINVRSGSQDIGALFWVVTITPILRLISGRPVLKHTGATCGLISFTVIDK